MADLRKYVQAQKFTLASGITTSDVSITLTSFNFPDGTAIAAGDLGSINYGTLEPGTGREEQISFTGITTNGDGTITLTGVVRGLGFGAVDTYSEQSNLKIQHGAGSVFILSNTAAFYNDFVNKGNDETMIGYLSVPTPTSGSHAVTKDYADALTTATALSYDKVIIAATAGESLAEGDLVYFDGTDNEWKRCDADTAATIDNVLLGTAQGAGTNGNPITGGVLIFGLDPKNTGYTAGVKLYAGNTEGAIVETPGTLTRAIGWSDTTGTLIFSPDADVRLTQKEKDAAAGGGDFGTPSASNKFLTEESITSNTILKPFEVVTFTSSGTWTKNVGLKYVVVEVVGGGGEGEGGGTSGTPTGNNGSTSSFGSHLSANGGPGGDGFINKSVATATGGDINADGSASEGTKQNDSGDFPTSGAPSFFGGGGQYGAAGATAGKNGGAPGAGGGGGFCSGSSNCRNGSGGYSGAYSKKLIPASSLGSTESITVGAGGSGAGNGGDGAAGIVIVTEYYL